MKKWITPGWKVVRVIEYLHAGESLIVRRSGKYWVLIHNGSNTGHKFHSAKDAIEYADDVRIHGH